jgi:hypothetical protein
MTHPTHTADQLAAAIRDAASVITTAARERSTPVLDSSGLPWIEAQCAQLRDAYLTGHARECAHIARTTSPTVMYAAAWRPAHLYCAPCAAVAFLDATEDNTCDRCRRTTDNITTGSVCFGPVVFAFGLCPPCADETGVANAPAKGPRR